MLCSLDLWATVPYDSFVSHNNFTCLSKLVIIYTNGETKLHVTSCNEQFLSAKIPLQMINGEIEERGIQEGRERKWGERQDEREQRGGGIEYVGQACGNSDAVFMDVYLSVNPKGSSHFPLGNSWSASSSSSEDLERPEK